jgi:tetrapyrrole methylase family protein / MazG family protein
MTLTIVGLGPGHVDDLTRKAWRVLKQAQTVFLRTAQHGCVACLPQTSATYHSFDELYATAGDFEAVYVAIVEQVMAAARRGDVVYAVPGDPLVGEATSPRLLQEARAAGIEVEIVNGISFVEPSLALLGIDALDGLQILDGIDIATMYHPPINPDYPALIGQVYSRQLASDLKLMLMNQYADEFRVHLIHAAGTADARVEDLALYEIDRSPHIGPVTALFLPALGGMSSFERFQEIIAHLRSPEGCPWDRKQTHESLRQFLLEEAYEVLEVIDEGDPQALAEELGDLLLQVMLHTQIAIDNGDFHMTDVLRAINQKMIRRHPHVWSDVSADDADQVVTNWEALKRQERNDHNGAESLLDSIPKGLPALLQAHQYQVRAAKVGFDWDDVADVRAKIDEELAEINAALGDPGELAKELGDLLFALVNWARWLGVEPENALREANARFSRRFQYVEQAATASGKALSEHTLEELDAYWNEAKARGL